MKSLLTSPACKLHLRLYTGQQVFDRKAALRQLHDLLEVETGNCELQILDGQEFRDLATEDEVVMTPMLVRISPPPVVRVAMPQPSSAALRLALNS